MPGSSIIKYAALDGGDLAEILEENLQGDTLSANDLPQAKMGAGGSVTWEVPTPEGVTPVSEIRGIVIHQKNTRVYWPWDAKGDEPPACQSEDGKNGYGSIDGGEPVARACDTCPLSQFGTAKNEAGRPGKGQACKLSKVLYLLTPDNLLPLVVALPPASLRNWRAYSIGMLNGRVGVSGVETILGLEQAKSAESNKTYTRVKPRVARRLEDVELAETADYAKSIRPILGA